MRPSGRNGWERLSVRPGCPAWESGGSHGRMPPQSLAEGAGVAVLGAVMQAGQPGDVVREVCFGRDIPGRRATPWPGKNAAPDQYPIGLYSNV